MEGLIRFIYSLRLDGKIFHRRIVHYAKLNIYYLRGLSSLNFSCHSSQQECVDKAIKYLLNKEEVDKKTEIRFEIITELINNSRGR